MIQNMSLHPYMIPHLYHLFADHPPRIFECIQLQLLLLCNHLMVCLLHFSSPSRNLRLLHQYDHWKFCLEKIQTSSYCLDKQMALMNLPFSLPFGCRWKPSSLHFLPHFINHVCNHFLGLSHSRDLWTTFVSQDCITLGKKGPPLSLLSNHSTPWSTRRIP